jgi:hypothetical protein
MLAQDVLIKKGVSLSSLIKIDIYDLLGFVSFKFTLLIIIVTKSYHTIAFLF